MTVIDLPTTTTDERPPDSFDAWCHADGCGIELDYSGKGRRPKFCATHRLEGERRPPKARANKPKATGANAQLAASATDALVQLNTFAVMGLMLTGMSATAGALSNAEDGFRESTNAALLTDPELCRTILRAGSTGGKVALAISYAMLAAAVAPVAVLEFKANRAIAQTEKEELPDADNRPEQPSATE
jgi:hypothetical protein